MPESAYVPGRGLGWPGEYEREAVKLYTGGLSCRGAAAAMKERHAHTPSQETIHQWAKAAGVLRTKSRADEIQNARRAGRTISAADGLRSQARKLRREHKWSVKYIAGVLGVSRNFVERAIFKKRSLRQRTRRRMPASRASRATRLRAWQADHPDVIDRIRAMHVAVTMKDAGATLPEIVFRTKRSKKTIWTWLRETGRTGSVQHPLCVAARNGA